MSSSFNAITQLDQIAFKMDQHGQQAAFLLRTRIFTTLSISQVRIFLHRLPIEFLTNKTCSDAQGLKRVAGSQSRRRINNTDR